MKTLSFFLIFLLSLVVYAADSMSNNSSDANNIPSLGFDNNEYREFESGQDAITWWSRLYAGLILSKEEKDIVYDYTFGNFFMINDKLRAGEPLDSLTQEQKEKVTLLDKTLSKTIIFENIKTYRYEKLGFITRLIDSKFFFENVYKNGKFIDGAAERYLSTLVDKKYQDYGFMSTTLLRNAVFQDRAVELIIKVPKFSDAMFVSMPELAAFNTQYELLFPRNRILTIESFGISQDRRRVSFVVKMHPPCYANSTCEIPRVDNLKQPNVKPLIDSYREKNKQNNKSL